MNILKALIDNIFLILVLLVVFGFWWAVMSDGSEKLVKKWTCVHKWEHEKDDVRGVIISSCKKCGKLKIKKIK